VFSRRMWPDFRPGDLAEAVREFRQRQRRFGAVPANSMRAAAGWLD
jgi:undecaprenyl diphosphate synthase